MYRRLRRNLKKTELFRNFTAGNAHPVANMAQQPIIAKMGNSLYIVHPVQTCHLESITSPKP